MTLVAEVFTELLAPKNMVTQILKKTCFRGPLDRQQEKSLETLWESETQHPYKIY